MDDPDAIPGGDVALAAPALAASIVEQQPSWDELPLPFLEHLQTLFNPRQCLNILRKRKVTGFFYGPPDPILAYNSKTPEEENWVPNELLEILESHAPSECDMDDDGNVDAKKLETAMTKVFHQVPTFCNFTQLRQFLVQFGELWGFRVATHATFQLVCCFGSPTQHEYVTAVSPSKQRTGSSQKCDCPFKVMGNTKIRNRRGETKVPRCAIPVHIGSNSKFLHDYQLCKPGVVSLRLAKRSAGAYFGALDLSKLEMIFSVMNERSSDIKLLRRLLKPYVPNHVSISACTINNIRIRVANMTNAGFKLTSSHMHTKK
jgi:hypothetical protein